MYLFYLETISINLFFLLRFFISFLNSLFIFGIYGIWFSKYLDLGLVQEWVAPNLLTVLSLMFNIIGFLFVIFEAGNDFSYKLSKLTTLVITITHYLYIFFII